MLKNPLKWDILAHSVSPSPSYSIEQDYILGGEGKVKVKIGNLRNFFANYQNTPISSKINGFNRIYLHKNWVFMLARSAK